MSRVADHAQRRRQVVEATMRVIAAQGMEGVKVAEVAREAGVSAGLVQRYFKTKDEMLLMTCEHTANQLTERLVKANEAGGTAKQRLQRSLAEFLPLDDERIAEVRIYLAFCGRTVENPDLRAIHAQSHRIVRTEMVAALVEARDAGELPPSRDVQAEAAALWALVDGIAMQAYFDPDEFPATTARAVVDAYVERLFTNSQGS